MWQEGPEKATALPRGLKSRHDWAGSDEIQPCLMLGSWENTAYLGAMSYVVGHSQAPMVREQVWVHLYLGGRL